MTNCAAENVLPFDECTRPAEARPAARGDKPGIEYLITVHRGRQLLRVYQPDTKNILLGRSSRCTLRLPDPSLPRIAGEIVLGPVPLLRKYKDGKPDNDFVTMKGEKPLGLGPYRITLLEPGDAILNLRRNRRPVAVLTVVLMAAIILVASLGARIIYRKVVAPEARMPEASSVIRAIERTDHGGTESKPRSGDPGSSAEEEVLPERSPAREDGVPDTTVSKVVKTPGHPGTPVVGAALRVRVRSIPEKELKRIVNHAREMIRRRDLATAGRTLAPLVPHLDDLQTATVVRALDPTLLEIYREAYILMPYDPDLARAILREIVDSGLELLPGHAKARKLLEDN